MSTYDNLKFRIQMSHAALNRVLGNPNRDYPTGKQILQASLTMGCDMTEMQCDAYLTLFILCKESANQRKRVELFSALLNDTWRNHVA